MTHEEQNRLAFSSLVASLAASAVAVLSQVEALLDPSAGPVEAETEAEPLGPGEVRKRVSDGLAGARQLIDTLAVLEVKTKGNLTPDEAELLGAALSDLRIRFVAMSNRPVPEAPK